MRLENKIASLTLVKLFSYLVIKLLSRTSNVLGLLKFKALVNSCGSNSYYNINVEIKHGENISIGNSTTIGPYVCLGAHSLISIGNNCRISRGVVIETAGLDLSTAPPYKHYSKPIIKTTIIFHM
jgi:acetyltransferase-like isoleucine patch superfamily enzyme